MAFVVIMPKQGQSVESCIIIDIKKVGDTIKKGDILFSYETDKAVFEEESSADGVVLEVFYNEGDEVPVLNKMMIIGNDGEDYSELMDGDETPKVEESAKETIKPETSALTVDVNKTSPSSDFSDTTKTKSTFISPRAKKLAIKESVDTSQLSGSGPQGRIIEKDIQEALANRSKMTPLAKKIATEEKLQPQGGGSGLAGKIRASDLTPPVNKLYGLDYEEKKVSNMRKLIGRSMHASLQNSAQLTHHLGADARRILAIRKKVKAAMDAGTISTNITLNDLVCYAVVKTLKVFPNVNTHFIGDYIRYFNKVHLALAVDTDRGLMVPVVRNADDLSITGLSNQLKEVANACRKGSINPDILAAEAGTFTVSNLGNYGLEMFTPIINLPQSAILGVNTITPRPKDLGDGVYGFVPYIGLSLTYDHRSLDGGEATRFLKQIATEIENLEIDLI
ncbi:MAG: dihydrolipoamide acetyltransferase family protein [Dysgonamonadaceae bacterium]|nr:dihydrolipoamide acetyltransferase family protein [Dysgonamonadaceae bacterium]MDD4727838.1 dihydrolipoamide acetyltransferase family protein [Dysgonamonadaceae bacterium]